MSEWQPVETAPTNVTVLAYWWGGYMEPAIRIGDIWMDQEREDEVNKPTHWMPLPAPPEPFP